MSLYHVVMTKRRVIMEFDVFIIISFDPTSTFIVLHPALHPKYVIFVILCHIFFSPQIFSLAHSLYATSPLSSLRSMLSWTSSGIITFVFRIKVYFHYYHRHI